MSLARRGFLKLLGSAAVALTLSRTLPGIAGETPTVPEPKSFEYALRKGDIITIEGRYAVNPVTRKTTGHLQNFIIVDEVSDDGSVLLHPHNLRVSQDQAMPVLLGEPMGDWQKAEWAS